MKQLFCAFFCGIVLTSYAQQSFEYFGIIKLNGNNKSVITYRLYMVLNSDKVTGYSVTDLGGEHETKNVIVGDYDSKSDMLNFRETDILYTKSAFSKNSFCFVNFLGKSKLFGNGDKIEGNFKGLFKDKQKCIDGTLQLVGIKKINKLVAKVNSRIQKSSKISENIKKQSNPIKIIDSLKINNLLKNQNLNVFVTSDKVSIEIWDPQIEDGDVINVYQNKKMILSNYTVVNKRKIINISLQDDQNVFEIEAVSEGYDSPNTAEILIRDNERIFELKSNLRKSEKAQITILKN